LHGTVNVQTPYRNRLPARTTYIPETAAQNLTSGRYEKKMKKAMISLETTLVDQIKSPIAVPVLVLLMSCGDFISVANKKNKKIFLVLKGGKKTI